MKKSTIFAIILLVLGITCCAVAVMLGVNKESTQSDLRFANYRETAEDKNLTANAVTSLELDIDAAECTIQVGDDWKLTGGKYVRWKQEGGTLVIEETRRSGWWFRSHPAQITLTIPQGTAAQMNQLDIDVDAGAVYANDLTARITELDVDAGEIIMKNFRTDRLTADVDAGTIELEGILMEHSEVSCDVGSIELTLLDGSAIGSIRGSVDVGSIDVTSASGTLYGSNDGFSDDMVLPLPDATGSAVLDVDCNVGSVEIHVP